jgi:glutamine synthetase
MSGSTARLQAIAAVTNYKPFSPPMNFAETPSGELFGANVFGTAEMETRLPKPVFKSLKKTIERGEKLDPSTAVAETMKSWAIERARITPTPFRSQADGRKHDCFLTRRQGYALRNSQARP